jgi:hypothetical protein
VLAEAIGQESRPIKSYSARFSGALHAGAGEPIRIDLEVAGLIPALARHEFAKFEQRILAEGCQDALLVWSGQNILLDGHNRYEICRRHQLPFKVRYLAFPDRQAARNFVVTTQLARRNLSPEGASYLRGMRHLAEKLPHGGARGRRLSGQHEHLKTAERLAGEFCVAEATVRRDGRFAGAVEAIAANCGAGAKKAMLARDTGMRRGTVLRLARLSPGRQQAAIGAWLENGRLPGRPPAENKTIMLLADPRSFAAMLVRKLGTARSREYLTAMTRVLQCNE